MKQPKKEEPLQGPWMVTLAQASLDEMAGACNELQRLGRSIHFIVPIAKNEDHTARERITSHIAIFTLPSGKSIESSE